MYAVLVGLVAAVALAGAPVTAATDCPPTTTTAAVTTVIDGNAGPAQFRPLLRNPDLPGDFGLLSAGESMSGGVAEVFDGPGTGDPIPITIPTVVCGPP